MGDGCSAMAMSLAGMFSFRLWSLALNSQSMPNDLTTPHYAAPRIVHSHLHAVHY